MFWIKKLKLYEKLEIQINWIYKVSVGTRSITAIRILSYNVTFQWPVSVLSYNRFIINISNGLIFTLANIVKVELISEFRYTQGLNL